MDLQFRIHENLAISTCAMKLKTLFGIEWATRGAMIWVPLVLLRDLFARTLGGHAVQAIGFLDLGIAFGFLVSLFGVGIIVLNCLRSRK